MCEAVIIGTNLAGANLKRCNLANAEMGEINIVSKDGTDTGRSHRTNFHEANLVRANIRVVIWTDVFSKMQSVIIDKDIYF